MAHLRDTLLQVRLRAVEPCDVDRLYLWENDRAIWPFGGTRAPLSRHQLWEYANNYDANPFSAGQLRLIIEVTEEHHESEETKATPCGTVDLYDIDPVNSRAMVGIMVIPAWRNRGIATRALCQAEEYCRNTLGLSVLASEVASDNKTSGRLFGHSCGYLLAGQRPCWFRRGDTFIAALLYQKKLR